MIFHFITGSILELRIIVHIDIHNPRKTTRMKHINMLAVIVKG